jgi:hypothetical protein
MRIRTIKPEFWRSDDIAALSLTHRLLFIGLWSYVDDNGVGIDDHRRIVGDLFALEEDQQGIRDFVRDGLATLSRALLIDRYEVDGRRYFYIRTWKLHQRVDRPNRPRYPEPPPDYKPPTSDDEPIRETNGRPSRHPRDTFATVSPPGTEEQRNRGTEEQGLKDSSAPRPKRAPKTPAGFDEFWDAYPRRTAKRAAQTAYTAALKRGAEPAELLTATRRFAAASAHSEARFIPHPATWLNQGRYDDEPQTQLAIAAGQTQFRPSTTDQRVAQGLALAAKYEALEALEDNQ